MFITKVLTSLKDFLQESFYPEHWIEMNIFLLATTLRATQTLSPHLRALSPSFVSDSSDVEPDSELVVQKELWDQYVATVLDFLPSRVLAIESLSWSARKSILNR